MFSCVLINFARFRSVAIWTFELHDFIEIEGKKACVQCCLSKQHKLWYNIGLLRRPDRSINDAKELKDIKVNGKRKIAEIANRKKDEAIRKLELEASDLWFLEKC